MSFLASLGVPWADWCESSIKHRALPEDAAALVAVPAAPVVPAAPAVPAVVPAATAVPVVVAAVAVIVVVVVVDVVVLPVQPRQRSPATPFSVHTNFEPTCSALMASSKKSAIFQRRRKCLRLP